jgi:tRNA threonylcarbamoyladenosine biosynthesis protein TsaE
LLEPGFWLYHGRYELQDFSMYSRLSTSLSATQDLASSLAKFLHGGEVIELQSDLGGGKTTFVKGLAAGLGYSGIVTSPTFTLSQIYPLPSGLSLHHYDLYRLTEAGGVGDELSEDIGDADIITVIEWAGIAEARLPNDRLIIAIEVTGENERRFQFSALGERSTQLIKDLKC